MKPARNDSRTVGKNALRTTMRQTPNSSARSRKRLSGAFRYAVLTLGSVLFVTPFVWLMLTSFKSDRDLVITDLASLLPKVNRTVSVSDPAAPTYRTEREGRVVLVRPFDAAVEPQSSTSLPRIDRGGAQLFEIVEPRGLRGYTVERDPALLRPASRALNVVETTTAPRTRGIALEDLPDGSVRARMASGELRLLAAGAWEPVRRIGLKTENYPDALDYLPEGSERGLAYLRNTLSLAVMCVIGTLLSSSLAAYAFARLRFRGKNLLFGLLLSTMLLPAGVTLLPQFLIFRSLGWVDSLAPLWAPAFLGSAFNIFILRQFFSTVPMELEDSARIDGCSPLRSYWSIMLPQVIPALIVIGVWTFIGAWNNFMGPLVYVASPENMPLSYALQLFHTERSGEATLEAAFAIMTLLPVIAVFFVAQKQIMENASLSGMGGR